MLVPGGAAPTRGHALSPQIKFDRQPDGYTPHWSEPWSWAVDVKPLTVPSVRGGACL